MDDPAQCVRAAIRKRLAGLTKLVRDEMSVIVADPPEPEWGTLGVRRFAPSSYACIRSIPRK